MRIPAIALALATIAAPVRTSASPAYALTGWTTDKGLPSGDVFVIGFAKPETARVLSTANEEMTLQIHPQPEAGFDSLVTIRYSQIRQHKQYAAPNQDGFTVTVVPIVD